MQKKQKNVSPSTLKGKMRKAPKNSKKIGSCCFLHICSGDADGGVIGDIQLAHFAFLKSSFSFSGSRERCCLEERTWDGETQCVRALYKLNQGRYRWNYFKLQQCRMGRAYEGELDWSPRRFYLIWSLTGHSIVFEVSWRVRTKVDYIDVLEWCP